MPKSAPKKAAKKSPTFQPRAGKKPGARRPGNKKPAKSRPVAPAITPGRRPPADKPIGDLNEPLEISDPTLPPAGQE